MGRWRGNTLGILLGLGAAMTAAGPVYAEGEPAALAEVAEVTLVEVPLLALGSDGAPLRGLGREDFELFDDGVSQPLHQVREIDLEDFEPAAFSESACPQSARRRLLLLFDLTGAEAAMAGGAATVRSAADALRALVLDHHLHPCDLVAVMTFEADTGPRLRLTWSSDRGQLLRALDLRPRAPPQPMAPGDPLRFQAATGLGLLGAEASGSERRSRRMLEHGRAVRWLRGLEELARMLADTPGTKTLALFTVSIDGRLFAGRAPPPPGPEALDSEEGAASLRAETGDLRGVQSLDLFGSSELRQTLARFAQQLRRADTRLRLVDLAGLATAGPRDVLNGLGLAHLAAATGAELTSGNDFATDLARWLERSKVTYLLTFQPAAPQADGRYHPLEVRLRGDHSPGIRLVHRPGYYAPRPFAALHPLEKDLLAAVDLLATRPRNELPFEVLLAPFRGDAQTGYVPLLVKIPPASRELEIYAYATDGEGRLRDSLHHRETLYSPVDGLKFYGHFELPAGAYRVRVLVRDAVRGRAGVQVLPLEVPDFSASRPFLLPPFFPDTSEGWQLAREAVDPQAREIVYPFTVTGEPFIPEHRPTTVVGEGRECVLVLYHFTDAAALSLEGVLMAADGTTGEVDLELLERVDRGRHGEKLRVLMTPQNVAAGEFTFDVVVTAADGRRARNQTPVRILSTL